MKSNTKNKLKLSKIQFFGTFCLFAMILTPFSGIAQYKGELSTISRSKEIRILYDAKSENPGKTVAVMDYVCKNELPLKKFPIASIQELVKMTTEAPRSSVLVYLFHGDSKGIFIGNEEYSWTRITNVLKNSKSKVHLFPGCYSERISTKNLKDKIIITQAGKVDLVIAALRTASNLARIFNNPKLQREVWFRVQESEVGLVLRLRMPLEPLWCNYTHRKLQELAIRRIADISWLPHAYERYGYNLANLEDILYEEYVNSPQDWTDPDHTDDNSALAEPKDLMNSLLNYNDVDTQNKINQALRHLSFQASAQIDIDIPYSHLKDELNATELESWHLLDPDKNGEVDIDISDLGGTGIDRIIECLEYADNFFTGTTIDQDYTTRTAIKNLDTGKPLYNVRPWLYYEIKAQHYLQDQFMPYHTCLILDQSDSKPINSVNYNYQFNAEDRFVSKSVDKHVPKEIAQLVFDNEPGVLEGIISIAVVTAACAALGFAIGSVSFTPFGGPIGALIGGIVAGTISTACAIDWKNKMEDAGEEVGDEGEDLAEKLTVLNKNIVKLYDNHVEIEKAVDSKSVSYLVGWDTKNGKIESYLDSLTDDTLINLAKSFADASQRQTLMEDVVGKSAGICEKMWEVHDYWVSLSPLVLTQLKEAAKYTAAVYLARYIREGDPDGDGFSTWAEEEIYKTDPNSKVITYTGSVYKLSTNYEIDYSFRCEVPCQKVTIMLYGVIETSPGVYTQQFIDFYLYNDVSYLDSTAQSYYLNELENFDFLDLEFRFYRYTDESCLFVSIGLEKTRVVIPEIAIGGGDSGGYFAVKMKGRKSRIFHFFLNRKTNILDKAE